MSGVVRVPLNKQERRKLRTENLAEMFHPVQEVFQPDPSLAIDDITTPQHPNRGHASAIGFKIMDILGQDKKTLSAYSDRRAWLSGGVRDYPRFNDPRPDSEIAALASITGTRDSARNGVVPLSPLDVALRQPKTFSSTSTDPSQKPLRAKVYIQNSRFFPCTRNGNQRPGMPCDEYIPSIIPRLEEQYPDTEFRIKVQDPNYITRYGYRKQR